MAHKKRDPKKEASWRRQIRRQARSGMTVRAWCLDQQVSEARFHWWRRELARRDGELKKSTRTGERKKPTRTQQRTRPAASSPAFVPVRVAADDCDDGGGRDDRDDDGGRDDPQAGESQIEIALPDGRCIRVTGQVDRQALADVLEVLTLTPSAWQGSANQEAAVGVASQFQRGVQTC